ncbi:MAG: glutamine-hydrolyzing carbamoyl-phosphate synthase small subunit [Candidatus Roizmanbacteria bacterium]|nr:glutamine-hydrolyzing carbamoyl-phosphate synthase small subunit [Candidatus Roizmanbacteria bacterium]
MINQPSYLELQDGSRIEATSFGYQQSISGELAFSTGMVGYPESLTDPSYSGQLLVLSYPLIGNYGVPSQDFWESSRIHVSGLVVAQYVDTPSHWQSTMTLSAWLIKQKIPALIVEDTRFLVQKIRTNGAMLGKIIIGPDIKFSDPNKVNLVSAVSCKSVQTYGKGKKVVVLIDCGVKRNILRSLIKRKVKVIKVPWNYDLAASSLVYDGIVVSNGPGDPKMCNETINAITYALTKNKPLLGICLGNQLLALAAGGDTYKLKFGHRGQNQPCREIGTSRCFLTTQNHGYAVGKIPRGFKPWFENLNDKTNEGIIHTSKPFFSVQFHPEACPGPVDTQWIFDKFISCL